MTIAPTTPVATTVAAATWGAGRQRDGDNGDASVGATGRSTAEDGAAARVRENARPRHSRIPSAEITSATLTTRWGVNVSTTVNGPPPAGGFTSQPLAKPFTTTGLPSDRPWTVARQPVSWL